MEHLFNPEAWKLSNPDLLQQIAALSWIKNDNPDFYKLITGVRVGYELYNRVSSERDIQLYQGMFITAIAEYVKKHPKASEAELTKEVQKQVELFKARVDAL